MAAFAGIIVNSCCWERCGCCCSDRKYNCDFCCIDNCKIRAAVAIRVLGCECCGSDTSDDVAAFAGIIVNSCCWERCGCCCNDSKDKCDLCCIDNCKIHSYCCSESAGL